MKFDYKPNEVRSGLSNKEFEEERSLMSGGTKANKDDSSEGLYKIDPRKEAYDRAKAFRELPDQAKQVEDFKSAFAQSNEGGKFYATQYNGGIPPELSQVFKDNSQQQQQPQQQQDQE
tara:strand:- start:1999 stop:2352 length:354 start_codon:yes stop_codon:yes gene_type:complete